MKAIASQAPFEVLSLAGSIADALQIWVFWGILIYVKRIASTLREPFSLSFIFCIRQLWKQGSDVGIIRFPFDKTIMYHKNRMYSDSKSIYFSWINHREHMQGQLFLTSLQLSRNSFQPSDKLYTSTQTTSKSCLQRLYVSSYYPTDVVLITRLDNTINFWDKRGHVLFVL